MREAVRPIRHFRLYDVEFRKIGGVQVIASVACSDSDGLDRADTSLLWSALHMVSPCLTRRRVLALVACAVLVLTVLPTFVAQAATPTVASLAAQLADDADSLAASRDELVDVRSELRRIRGEHQRLRTEVEARLVAIYKYGDGGSTIERMASGESMRDVGRSLDALDRVARSDSRLLVRWRKLDRKRTRLIRRRATLERRITHLEKVVQDSRERLSAAEAKAAAARREAANMARIADSPILPKVGHPETTVVQASGGGGVSPNQPIGFTQSGIASYYHDSFAGQNTADGEVYDPQAFTAAHRFLPFGTWVTVSGPRGSIQVRINDRGPFVAGRIIDLSRAAAEAIGVTLSPVTISVVA